MTIKVIGAGFGRTGTLSLKFALEQLGFEKCYHMIEVRQHPDHVEMWRSLSRGESIDWHGLYAGYQASVDWPSCNFWREQMNVYPEAKVILTVRDSKSWYQSVMNTIWKASQQQAASNPGASSAMVFEVIWDGIFDGRMEDESHVIAQYDKHNKAVVDEVPKDQLLVFEAKQGWPALCEFLGCSIPSGDYPRVNSTKEFVVRLS